ncbi:MAG: helix-turn-helix transcriptional regulator [Cyanobacteriota bacterium]|mgnify:FL=1|jgi:predicted transcription factor, homolog of eukaryotic MBF1|nr:helix-turn-helix transcriptional regulator [bacterium]MBR1907716.1 helix-turn-helix transcriptional regulator [bacterium]MEE0495041.1 helix-turn-helix transcriptional regulator [Cyanobacteriota bacterium]
MSKKDLQKFGKRLKALRLDHNLTQLELAEILDMSPNFIGMIERGERNTTVENVFKIARALNVKPSNLFEEL